MGNIEDITNINNITNIDKIKNQIKYFKWKTNGKQENKTYTDSVDLLNIEDITNINNITNIDNIKKLIEKLISKHLMRRRYQIRIQLILKTLKTSQISTTS